MADTYATEFARKGGQARAKKLSPKERKESASRAAKARWEKTRKMVKELREGAKALLRESKKAEKRSAQKHAKIKKLLQIAKGKP